MRTVWIVACDEAQRSEVSDLLRSAGFETQYVGEWADRWPAEPGLPPEPKVAPPVHPREIKAQVRAWRAGEYE